LRVQSAFRMTFSSFCATSFFCLPFQPPTPRIYAHDHNPWMSCMTAVTLFTCHNSPGEMVSRKLPPRPRLPLQPPPCLGRRQWSYHCVGCKSGHISERFLRWLEASPGSTLAVDTGCLAWSLGSSAFAFLPRVVECRHWHQAVEKDVPRDFDMLCFWPIQPS
jgi:hypothetical protein